jgi:hypothetical protein
MFQDITYFPVFGKPLIMYLGILTLLAFLLTASIAVMNLKGIRIIPFRWHPRCAACAVFLALVHGLLGMLAYF